MVHDGVREQLEEAGKTAILKWFAEHQLTDADVPQLAREVDVSPLEAAMGLVRLQREGRIVCTYRLILDDHVLEHDYNSPMSVPETIEVAGQVLPTAKMGLTQHWRLK